MMVAALPAQAVHDHDHAWGAESALCAVEARECGLHVVGRVEGAAEALHGGDGPAVTFKDGSDALKKKLILHIHYSTGFYLFLHRIDTLRFKIPC